MGALWIVIATAFVLLTLGVVVYGVFALFGHHSEQFRDGATGRRLGASPHLETRDEFEHRTAAY
jgi:flagellar basal body-associated protein FliL